MPRYNLTALQFHFGALACSVSSPVRYSQARTYSTIITTIQMKEDIENTSTSSKETRNVFIGAKVTPTQKEQIKSLAAECGMTVSDYLLSCAYNFKPKARLTKEEAALLQNLGRLSVRPRKVHLCAARNVHKATHGNVQSDSVHGRLAQGTWQCSRKRLPVPECSKREE